MRLLELTLISLPLPALSELSTSRAPPAPLGSLTMVADNPLSFPAALIASRIPERLLASSPMEISSASPPTEIVRVPVPTGSVALSRPCRDNLLVCARLNTWTLKLPAVAVPSALAVKMSCLAEVALRFSNRAGSLRSLIAIWKSEIALRNCPRPENLAVVSRSRRLSCAVLGALSAFTMALTILLISRPEPTPVKP